MTYGAGWERSQSNLRASDADRERVADFLREQAAVGRLTTDELEERVGLAYRAVTVGDLERLMVDLPRRQPPARRPGYERHAHHPHPQHRRHRGPGPLLPLGLLAVIAMGGPMVLGLVAALGLAVIAAVFALSVVIGPLVVIGLLVMLAVRRRRPRGPVRFGPSPY